MSIFKLTKPTRQYTIALGNYMPAAIQSDEKTEELFRYASLMKTLYSVWRFIKDEPGSSPFPLRSS